MTTLTAPASDFYGLERTLEPSELAVLHAVRAFMHTEVEPIINDYWTRARFPFQILDGFRQLGIAGLPYEGYGCPGHSRTLDGMVSMEIARTERLFHLGRRTRRGGHLLARMAHRHIRNCCRTVRWIIVSVGGALKRRT